MTTAASGWTEPATGLSTAAAQARLAQDGPNELADIARRRPLHLLREVLSEPMFLLLGACGAIYLALGDRQEALMLLGFVVVVIGITLVQQRRSERALDALRALASPQARVLRDGQVQSLPARNLVAGDIVLLSEGDRVPADLLLCAATHLVVDESLLTGESEPQLKQAQSAVSATLPDSACVFAGTLVTQGDARGQVLATGARSALGRIGQSLQGLAAEATPIQQETRRVVRQVALWGLALAAGLALAQGLRSGSWLQGLLAGLTLAMAVLPEELPVVLSLFLGLGAWRLSREQVLARSVPAVELLGATTVLCVDKTGTLTENRMALRRLWSPAASHDSLADAGQPLQEALHALLEFAVLASHRRAVDPMELALVDSGARLLAGTEHLHADWTLVDDYPLAPEMLAMSRVWQSPDQHARLIAAKGAPEAIADLCHLDPAALAALSTQVAHLAAEGLRVLGVARALFDAAELPGQQHDFDFEFLGLVALADPLRADVPAAVQACRAAGIRVVMITGDHPATALAIAGQAGLSNGGLALTGAELASLDEAALARRLADTQVFCRVSPAQKLRLVQAFRAQGQVVAMTGDGVNDAPALKAAHIGVAMGARGTDVARAAADLVLLKDDFASLLTAVRYGRRVFANLRKAIVFVVAVHVPIVGLSLLPVLLGWPLLLMPVHILFLQLIIDPACSMVFEAEPLEPGTMRQPPRPAGQRLFDRGLLWRGLWQGAGLLALLLGLHPLAAALGVPEPVARATSFSALVLGNLALIAVNRRWDQPLWAAGGGRNPAFGGMALLAGSLLAATLYVPAISRLFGFQPPSGPLLLAAVAVAGLALAWFEAVKWGLARRPRRAA